MENNLNENDLSIKNLKEYIYKNRYIFMVGAILFFLIYGRELYVLNARVDTEFLINNPNDVFNWLAIGRQGAIFTRILFEQLNFNPYFVTILAFIIFILSMITFGYLLHYVGKVKSSISVIIFLIFLVHPIWVEQLYFTLQILVMAVAIFLLIISVLMSFWAINHNKKVIKILSIILMVWAFSTYQLFMILYVALSIFCFILFYKQLYWNNKKDNSNVHICVKIIFQLISLFLIAVIINGVITKIFFSSGAEYLTDQIRWGIDPAESCIKNILGHIIHVITGDGVFYSYSYIISAILMLSCLFYDIFYKKYSKLKWLYVLAGFGFQACPFLLTIYGGTVPVFRAQFVLPFIIACNIGIVMIFFSSTKYIKMFSYVICFFIFINQLQIVMRMQYTDDIRFQEDMRLATQISERIDMVTNGEEKPIAFVGTRPAQLNSSCIQGELIGMSIFNVNSDVKPHFTNSSDRIVNLLKTMGFKMQNVTYEQMFEARKIAHEMSIWPAKESIYDEGEFVVVKLSEDCWYGEDIMPTKSEKVEIENLSLKNDEFKWAVDNVVLENGMLKIHGWLLKPNISSKNLNTTVYLINDNNYTIVKIATYFQERGDLNKTFPNEADYTNSGYIAKALISDFDDDLSKYRIILAYENNEEKMFIDTGVFINK